MPAQYLHIKESYLAKGKSPKEAKRIAAATYNSQHPGNPVGPHYEEHHKTSRRARNSAMVSEMRRQMKDMGRE